MFPRFAFFPQREWLFVTIVWIALYSFAGTAVVPADQVSIEVENCQCQVDNSSPVCGTNGKTYDNFCRLRCDSRVFPGLGGKCRGKCPCPDASPLTKTICDFSKNNCPYQIPKGEVCGTDNTTFTDSCKFLCAQATQKDLGVQCGGACPCPKPESPCSRCPEEYQPMCGTNGVTYGNQCMFACARMTRPDLFPSCRHECPCDIANNARSAQSHQDILFLNHLKQNFLFLPLAL